MNNDEDGLLKLSKALEFAVRKHDAANQTREDLITPYWVHPFRVSERLKQAGVDDYDVLAAALLHDVIEDTGTTEKELKDSFGPKVAQIVLDVSQAPDQSLSAYHDQVSKASKESQTVKLADKLDNVNELRRMKYTTYGGISPLKYIKDAEDTLEACSHGNPTLRKLLSLEIKKASQQF